MKPPWWTGSNVNDEQRLVDTKQEISKLRRRVQELETLTAKLYEDKYSGAINESTFMVLTKKTNRSGLPGRNAWMRFCPR